LVRKGNPLLLTPSLAASGPPHTAKTGSVTVPAQRHRDYPA